MEELKHTAPLAGLKVIELGQIAAGPFAGLLLADLGADVVKVEPPQSGDGMRGWPPLISNEDGEVYSGNFASLNRNKRSIVIDLKDPKQLQRLKQLCARADVFLENYRPGVLRRLGLGYDDLRAINPRLVYCSISGYGQTGPYAQKGAYDVTIQAMSGLMSVTGEEKGPPVKCGVPVADFVAGLYAAYTIVVAVRQAERTGRGTVIDCSMLGSLLGISALQTSEYYGTGSAPRRLGTVHPRNAPYQGYMAKDRMFVLAAGNDRLWRSVCEVVGRPELADDERFATQVARAAHQKELTAILQPIFATRTAQEWLRELDERGVPCAPVNDFHDILHDPHVLGMGIIGEVRLPNGITTPNVGFPVRMSHFTFSVYRNPPKLGEHQEDVFRDWLAKDEGTG